MKRFGYILVVVAVGIGSGAFAQDGKAPEKIDLSDGSMIVVDDTVIPLPLEIFASLDKLGQQNWGAVVGNRDVKRFPDRSRSALLFGLIVSDGFIAVQAKDSEAVKRIGRDVMDIAQALAVAPQVAKHANAVVLSADKEDWPSVRLELDRTRQTVLDHMRRNRDGEMAKLVSLGGWLGGTKALASILRGNYSAEGSDLLNQPDLVRRLKKDFEALSADAKEGQLFVKVEKTLQTLEDLMKPNRSGAISEKNVGQISSETDELVDAIYES